METNLILKNFDNGTITKDAAIDLLLQHTPRAYAIGAYLEARIQRDEYREKLYDLQDEKPRGIMSIKAVTDLIDHALATGYIMSGRAKLQLIEAGMDPDTAQHHVDTVNVIADRDLERVEYLDNPETAPGYCTRCGVKVKAHELSRRGICVECSTAAVEECLIALDTKTGPVYRRWRDAMLSFAYKLEDQAIKERPKLYAGTLGDYIDQDKHPGCDAECDLCDTSNCPHRDQGYDWKSQEPAQ